MTELSKVQGPPLEEEEGIGPLTMGGYLADIAGRFAGREAMCWREAAGEVQRWSYAELYAESQRVARALLAQGVGKGSRVGLLVSNRPEWLLGMFGSAMAGAVTVALNTFSTREELAYQLQHADVEMLIFENAVASRDFLGDLAALCPGLATAAPGELVDIGFPYLRRLVCLGDPGGLAGVQPWDEFLAGGDRLPAGVVQATLAASSPVDPGFVFFSSGSTGRPKAIQQTQRGPALQCWRFCRWFETDASVRTWSANGFFFSGNFCMALGSTLSVGGCLVLQRYFQPEEALQLMQDERVTLPLAWPHQHARLRECEGWDRVDLSSLVYVDVDSALAGHPTVDSSWHQPQGYGITEAFTFLTGRSGSEFDGTHGSVLPGNSLRIVDPESGVVLPLGETGEIVVKGPTMMPGFLKVPPEQTFDGDGFYHTRDAGHLLPNGRLVWEGRLSDIIKTGGANVAPAEIDAVLARHEAVQTAFTVGVPHETLGEMVVACVVLREGMEVGEQALREFAREALSSYKVPRRIFFLTEEELPTTGSNKVRRGVLAEKAAALLETKL